MSISSRPTALRSAPSRISRNGSERDGPEPSLGELLAELSQDVSHLVRQEVQLAKVEMQEKLTRITTDLASLAVGGVMAALGGLALMAALVLFLVNPVGLPPWLAALIVAAVFGIGGGLMLRRGITDLKRTDPAPRRTIETIREDLQMVKELRP